MCLARQGRDRDSVLRFEALAGLVEVRVIRAADGQIRGATIGAPRPLSLGAEVDPAAIAACASLRVDQVRRSTNPARRLPAG